MSVCIFVCMWWVFECKGMSMFVYMYIGVYMYDCVCIICCLYYEIISVYVFMLGCFQLVYSSKFILVFIVNVWLVGIFVIYVVIF